MRSSFVDACEPGRNLQSLSNLDTTTMAEQACYTVVREDSSEGPTTQDLRNALQKGTDETKIETLRTIIVSTLNGNPHVRVSSSRARIKLICLLGGSRHY